MRQQQSSRIWHRLKTSLTDPQVRGVLAAAHDCGPIKQRSNLKKLVLAAFRLFYLPPEGKWIWRLTERRCVMQQARTGDIKWVDSVDSKPFSCAAAWWILRSGW